MAASLLRSAGSLFNKEVMMVSNKALYIERTRADFMSVNGGPRVLCGIVTVLVANVVSTGLPFQGTDARGAPTSLMSEDELTT